MHYSASFVIRECDPRSKHKKGSTVRLCDDPSAAGGLGVCISEPVRFDMNTSGHLRIEKAREHFHVQMRSKSWDALTGFIKWLCAQPDDVWNKYREANELTSANQRVMMGNNCPAPDRQEGGYDP